MGIRGLPRRLWFSLESTSPERDSFLLDCIKITFTYSYLMENFSLINSHNLLKNLLLFPTEITNLLFVIKNRQSLKQNFMRNCKKTMIKKKEWLYVLYFVTLRYGILTIGTWDSFFPSSCFSGQNGMLSATEQNQTYNHSFFFKRLTTIQLNIFY